jgi:hypothetical protein
MYESYIIKYYYLIFSPDKNIDEEMTLLKQVQKKSPRSVYFLGDFEYLS